MRLIRTIVLLGAVVFLMPNPPVEKDAPPVPTPSKWALMSAAAAAFEDVKLFCTRQENVCETADYVIMRVEAKAKYSLKLINDWANDRKEEARVLWQEELQPQRQFAIHVESPAVDDITTGSTASVKDLRGSFTE